MPKKPIIHRNLQNILVEKGYIVTNEVDKYNNVFGDNINVFVGDYVYGKYQYTDRIAFHVVFGRTAEGLYRTFSYDGFTEITTDETSESTIKFKEHLQKICKLNKAIYQLLGV